MKAPKMPKKLTRKHPLNPATRQRLKEGAKKIAAKRKREFDYVLVKDASMAHQGALARIHSEDEAAREALVPIGEALIELIYMVRNKEIPDGVAFEVVDSVPPAPSPLTMAADRFMQHVGLGEITRPVYSYTMRLTVPKGLGQVQEFTLLHQEADHPIIARLLCCDVISAFLQHVLHHLPSRVSRIPALVTKANHLRHLLSDFRQKFAGSRCHTALEAVATNMVPGVFVQGSNRTLKGPNLAGKRRRPAPSARKASSKAKPTGKPKAKPRKK